MKPLRILLIILSFTFVNAISAQTVYTTKTGEKYHKSNCKYLKYSKKEYKLEKAIALGFSACSVCKPNKNNTVSKSSNLNTTSGNASKATASQCTGKTKAGKRCKRKTKSANGRCYQH